MNIKSLLTPFINFQIVNNTSKSQEPACDGYFYFYSSKNNLQFKAHVKKMIEEQSLSYQEQDLLKSDQNFYHFLGTEGPVWIVCESSYAAWRDRMGLVVNQIRNLKLKNIQFQNELVDELDFIGVITGLELAYYQFLPLFKKEKLNHLNVHISSNPKNTLFKKTKDLIQKAQIKSTSVQIARHLVNLPPNFIHPESIQNLISNDLSFSKSSQITIWDSKKCEKEGLNLLLAVGAGGPKPPRMIHIKYRPKVKNKKKIQPIAFVGKGITFDTGGLDIKPSSAMRLMKKDMGGAAAIIGLAYWVDHIKLDHPCDFYLALAENSIDALSMRPSDVYKSHAGYYVEIDNTDAEGRLVLADAMSVAAQSNDKPKAIIDMATLTGAIKVALGTDIAGLFSNNDQLAHSLNQAGSLSGELNWRMPLVKKYWTSLNSNYADFKNSGESFGGAITAALFLEKFCHEIPWAHLDIYAWADRPDGALTVSGGNGQGVQTLMTYLENLK